MKNLPGTIYLAVVLCLSACGGSEPEPVEPQAPSTPTGLVLHSSSQTSLAFQWEAVNGADSYEYDFRQDGTTLKSATVTTRNAVISDLVPDTGYSFAVRSVSGSLKSSWTSYIDARTEKKPEEPEPSDPADPNPIGTSEEVYAAMKMPAAENGAGALAFPGAEGGGMKTTGGRGGKVYHVTTLDDSGSEGSLRWAVGQSGARTVVFDVAGIIELKSDLKISKGDLTIAGQTAPGDGICLKNYATVIAADNVIIRFLRFRLGDEAPWSESDIAAGKADSQDAIWGRGQKNIILDHCSMSWSIDECASFYGNTNFTMQWCVITESMRSCRLHTKGSHGYGGIWGGDNASFHHNLLSDHDSRNPRFDHDYVSTVKGPVHFINNVIYCWGGNTAYGGESAKGAEPRKINIVANYYKPGANSSNKSRIVNPTTKCSNCNKDDQYDIVPGLFWVADNYMYGSEKVTSDNWEGVEPDDKSLKDKVKASAYMGTHTGTMHTAEKAMEKVCAYAGASLSRDDVDKRACGQVSGNSGTLIDDTDDLKAKYGFAWPSYKASDEQKTTASKDSDKDGIPDWYEVLLGLDKNNATDASAATIDPKERYSNLEMYLHYLVRDIIAGQNADGTYK